jgi:tetratricopeptide (TPR) repeat protein
VFGSVVENNGGTARVNILMTTAETNSAQRLLIGEILVQADIVGEHQLPRVLQMAKDRSLRIGQVLIMMRFLTDEELEPILEIQRLINDGGIDSGSAIEALRIMRRDGLPLERAVEKVRLDQPGRTEYDREIKQVLAQIDHMEKSNSATSRELVPLVLRLGDLSLALKDKTEAERHYKRAISILERSHGSKHAKIVPALTRLLDLYTIEQRYGEAETLCWRTVEVNQSTYGAEHLETARSFQRLARIHEAQGRSADAEQFLLSTIRIMEKQLGVEHPELKAALRHYSSFWKRSSKQSEHKKIGELLVDSGLVTADQLSAALQESHEKEIPLGQSLVKQGVITQNVLRAGLQCQLLALDGVIPVAVATKALRLVSVHGVVLEDALDEIGWHPDPISTKDLQRLLDSSDELMAAEKALGANHPGVSIIAMKLGEQYMYARKFAYAEAAYKRALHILKQCWGQNSIELSDCLFKLANLYYVQKRYTEAEALHWKVLEIRKNAHGEEHPEVAQSLEQIAKLASAQGNDAQSAQLLQAAALIRSKGSDERIQTLAFLSEITLFRVLEEKMLDRVSGLVERLTMAEGQELLKESEKSEALYVVQSGRVDVLREGRVVTCVQPGECFGFFGSNSDDSADGIGAVAIEAGFVLRFGCDIIRDLRVKYPEFDNALADASDKLKGVKTAAPGVVAQAFAVYASGGDDGTGDVGSISKGVAAAAKMFAGMTRGSESSSLGQHDPFDAAAGVGIAASGTADKALPLSAAASAATDMSAAGMSGEIVPVIPGASASVVIPGTIGNGLSTIDSTAAGAGSKLGENADTAAANAVAGLQGNLAFFDLATVLQTISNSRKDGNLRLKDRNKVEIAVFGLKQGQLVSARYRHLQGLDAIYDLITSNFPLDFAFEQTEDLGPEDRMLSALPLTMIIMEAARRSDEMPALLESVGWPRVAFKRAARVLDCSSLPEEVASVAADIWLLLEGGAESEKIVENVYSDRYTFLIALREMLNNGLIRRDDAKTTGSFSRLSDIRLENDGDATPST